MSDAKDPGIDIFNRDAESNRGYLYTTNIGLSSQLATQRSTDTILQIGQFTDRSVLDVGCGDGFYTCRYWDIARPSRLAAIDMAEKAIKVAIAAKGDPPIEFRLGNAHKLPYPKDSVELVILQSILHHDDNPLGIITEAFRVAPEVLIHEPNGNNPGLKVLERVMPYHREHHEKSYSSRKLAFLIRQARGEIVRWEFAGFVPMFCPDWLAWMTKAIEPLVERTPLLRTLACAVYIVVARRHI